MLPRTPPQQPPPGDPFLRSFCRTDCGKYPSFLTNVCFRWFAAAWSGSALTPAARQRSKMHPPLPAFIGIFSFGQVRKAKSSFTTAALTASCSPGSFHRRVEAAWSHHTAGVRGEGVYYFTPRGVKLPHRSEEE